MASSSSSGNKNPRTIVVSNRLPVGIKHVKVECQCFGEVCKFKKGFEFPGSAGGLVSAFSGLGIPFTWMGWPEISLTSKEDQETLTTELSKLKIPCVPVWVDETLGDDYYNGYSNSVLWPTLHNFPSSVSPTNTAYWNAYDKVNDIFANAINAQLQDGDLIWIQDYHLMLVPQKLRQLAKKNIKIGWFLHTPFPTPDHFSQLKARENLLRGILNSDLVGFHTMDHARNFLETCKNKDIIPNLVVNGLKVKLDNHYANVSVFPVGINPKKFTNSLNDQKVKEHIQRIKAENPGAKIIVGVDRLDYIKGIPEKMDAMKTFLSEPHDNRIGKVVLIQIAVPTRQDVEEYKKLKAHVDNQVADINRAHPKAIEFKYEKIDHELLVALYAVSDVCLVTSSKDGMNLVAYEYIASQQEKHGVLILSEFAGAAKSLDGAITINPYNKVAIVDAIRDALVMNQSEREKRYSKLWKYVETNTAASWGSKFVNALKAAN